MIKQKTCRHGDFSFFGDDEFVGLSLSLYGEYSEGEVAMLAKVLREGDIAIDAGANIGALTVPMAKFVGSTGKVIAFEPGEENADLLRANLASNHLANVELHETAASSYVGSIAISPLNALGHKNFGRVEVGVGTSMAFTEKIDNLHLDRLKLIKIDVEGHELEVIKGASETIKRCRPIIYCENDRPDKAEALIAALIDLDYRLYWHRPPLYSKDNFERNTRNVFGNIVSINMICVPEERGIDVMGCDEVSDLRIDDDMFNREIVRYRKRVERNPDDLTSRLMTAHYLNLMQRRDEADAALAENLRRDPNHLGTQAIKGLLGIQRGQWHEGWQAYELRLQQKSRKQFGGDRTFKGEPWDGRPTDKPLLISSEQGFGDSIMFGRFFRDVLARAPNAMLEVQPQLYELFEFCEIAPRGRLFRQHRTLPHYDLYCSLPSTPAKLDAGADMIARNEPYLFADPAMVDIWHNNTYPKIGLCSVGSPKSERPFTRDLPSQYVAMLGKKFGPFLTLANTGQFESYFDTAAAIAALDLVISVDTSVAHLAGAMGKPVWLLLSFDPDWRWGLDSESTIWYPSMRIFRQPKFRDWQSVIDTVSLALETPMQSAA